MFTAAEAKGGDSISGASTAADDESFIILGSSACASLAHSVTDASLADPAPEGGGSLVAEDLLRDFSTEGGQAFRAHFKLDSDAVSESSLSLAEHALERAGGDLRSLAVQVASLLDENVILRETLRSNNAAVRERLVQLAKCQDDVCRTQRAHRDKFRQTRSLVEHLRAENAKLQQEMERVRADCDDGARVPRSDAGCGNDTEERDGAGGRAGGSLEFVPSPDDDTLHKLTAQLELVERERRQVITENEALTWQKESLERLLDAASTERDRRGDQLAAAQVELRKLTAALHESRSLVQELYELRIKLKSSAHIVDTVEILRGQVGELRARLQDAQAVNLKPSWAVEARAEDGDSEEGRFTNNVRLYEKSLQHLTQLLNRLNTSALEGLAAAQELCSVASQRGGCSSEVAAALSTLHTSLQHQHATALQQTGQVRATIDIFDGIFQDYQLALTRLKDANSESVTTLSGAPLDTLAAALVSREQELRQSAVEAERLRALVVTLQQESDQREHLRAQLQAYRDDFIAERECRERLACDKDNMMAEMRALQRQNEGLKEQLEEVRRMNPDIHRHATAKRAGPRTGPRIFPSVPPPATATPNTVYTCPKCAVFSCSQYQLIEEHVERCLDE